jgi:hypothetical protein
MKYTLEPIPLMPTLYSEENRRLVILGTLYEISL